MRDQQRDCAHRNPRATEEEVALHERIHQTRQTTTRLDEKKSEVEKRFAELWKRKRDLSNDKQDHTAAINALEMFSSQRPGIAAELATVNDTLAELGQQLAARNFSAGKDVSELYARSMNLSANLERNLKTLDQTRAKIASLAPNAAEYDQVVILIAQMDEFFNQLNAALNGVLDAHTLPPTEAE